MAAETPPTQVSQRPDDSALATLQTRLAIADAQLKMLKNHKDAMDTLQPASSIQPSTGAFTMSGGNPFPGQKKAYQALDEIAKEIAVEVDKTPGNPPGKEKVKVVFIFDPVEMNNVVNFNAIKAQKEVVDGRMELLVRQMKGFEVEAETLAHDANSPPSPLAAPIAREFPLILAPALIEGSLKTVADMTGMFLTDTAITFNSYTPDDLALVAALIHALTED